MNSPLYLLVNCLCTRTWTVSDIHRHCTVRASKIKVQSKVNIYKKSIGMDMNAELFYLHLKLGNITILQLFN